MPKDRVIAGIDIGSTKITTLISVLREDEIHVIGVATTNARGIRKGQIVDIDEAVLAITECLEATERMAGCSIASAFVSVGGTHIECLNSKGVVAVSEPQGEISDEDVRRVTEAARAISLPSTKDILHVLPRGYIVDAQEGVKDPVGMTGVRLEVETHIVTGAATAMRNLAKCVGEVGVDVEGLVFAGVASSEAVLTETEKELGVILVDLGGGVTDVCMFVDGSLAHSAVLPIGAKNVTNDIAIGLRVSLESAEKIKLFLGQKPKTAVEPEDAMVNIGEATKNHDKKPKEEMVNLAKLGIVEDVREVAKRTLVEGIMKPRLREIFNMIALEIKRSGFGGFTPAGIVLTGGGAETLGAVEICKQELAMPVRLGTPTGVKGLIDEIEHPAYSTAVGLLLYGAKTQGEGIGFALPFKSFPKIQVRGVFSKGLEWLKGFLP